MCSVNLTLKSTALLQDTQPPPFKKKIQVVRVHQSERPLLMPSQPMNGKHWGDAGWRPDKSNSSHNFSQLYSRAQQTHNCWHYVASQGKVYEQTHKSIFFKHCRTDAISRFRIKKHNFWKMTGKQFNKLMMKSTISCILIMTLLCKIRGIQKKVTEQVAEEGLFSGLEVYNN